MPGYEPITKAPVEQYEAERGQRRSEKLQLLLECCLLQNQAEAVKDAMDQRKARLKLLMDEDGQPKLSRDEGAAFFESRTTYKVANELKLSEMFTAKELAAIAKPTKTFREAAIKSGRTDVDAVLESKTQRTFKVERTQTKEQKQLREDAIRRSRSQAEERLQEMLAKLQ